MNLKKFSAVLLSSFLVAYPLVPTSGHMVQAANEKGSQNIELLTSTETQSFFFIGEFNGNI